MDFELAVSIDSETRLFDRGEELAPEVACISYCYNDGPQAFEPQLITGKDEMRAFLHGVLTDPMKPVIVGQNFSYDAWCFMRAFPELKPLFFAAYDSLRVEDTMLGQRLLDIAHGCLDGKYWASLDKKVPYYYSLAALYERYGLGKLDKGNERMTFGELIGVPGHLWPAAHVHYAKLDALATLQVWTAQQEWPNLLKDSGRQSKYALALQKLSINGMHTDEEYVRQYIGELSEKIAAAEVFIREQKLLRKDGSRDTKAAKRLMAEVCAANDIQPKLTATGEISLDAEAVRAVEDLSPVLEAYALFSQSKMLLQRAEDLLDGSRGLPLQTQFVSLLENGRTSSRIPKDPIKGVQLQNFPRKGKLRECFVPKNRDTHYFCSIDFNSDEMVSFAQAELDMTGKSILAEALNAVPAKDPHCMFAAALLDCPYEEVLANKKHGKYKEARQIAKAFDFGFLGGLGAEGFMRYVNRTAKKPEDRISLKRAREVHAKGYAFWKPDAYFDAIRQALGGEREGRCTVTQLRSERVRGMLDYPGAANTMFSGLSADGNKDCLYEAVKHCELAEVTHGWADFIGCRVVGFFHDELFYEVPIATATRSSEALCALQLETKKKWNPDVRSSASPAIMRRWYKDADEVRCPLFGTLLPWEPEATDK